MRVWRSKADRASHLLLGGGGLLLPTPELEPLDTDESQRQRWIDQLEVPSDRLDTEAKP